MATDTPNQAATIPIPTTEPELPLVPLDESALNPEYDPAKDQRAAFLKMPLQTTGPTISPAPKPSLVERAKKVVTEGIPRYSTRTVANPKFGQEQFLAPEEAMTPEEQRQAPVAAGALEAAGGLTSPATISTVAATAGLGEAGVIPKVLSGLFAGQIAASVYDQYPALKDAVNRAQTAKTKAEHDDAFADAQRLLTHMGADTVLGLLAAKHGAEGAKEILDSTTGAGVPDRASTFKAPKVEPAPAPEETHPEMNRETVKSLQKLGYSNQHITNFNIGEIRDILKNETPAAEHPVSQPAAAPDPEAFAEYGGKLVSPQPKVSPPAETPAATETGAADPIEDFIMSDKVKGKVVRPAAPQPAAAPDPEAFAEHGGKLVGKAPEPTAPSYHPDLQKMITQNKIVSTPPPVGFITPDGKFVALDTHHNQAIQRATREPWDEWEVEENIGDQPKDAMDNRVQFLNDTGAVRTRLSQDKSGTTTHISVPAQGVTPEQIPAIQQAIAKAGRNGNVVLERADVTPETKDELTMSKEFPRAADAEDYLRQIQAHPDQQDLVSKELQTPHKETYGMEVTDMNGEVKKVPIDAHSPKQALKTLQKQFPNAQEWRLDTMPEEKAPSTEYSVPTSKNNTMPESMGRTVESTLYHEYGHAMAGQNAGLVQNGMVSSSHPRAGSGTRAGILWDSKGIVVPGLGPFGPKIRSEKLPALITGTMGGIAADEVFNDVPRRANHNFNITTESSDGNKAYHYLRAEGMSHEDALDFMHKKIDENVAYLKQEGVASVLRENVGFREKGLSRQFHASPERLKNMHLEAQRRIANAKQSNALEGNDNGAVNGGRDQNGGAAHTRGKGEGTTTPVGQPQEGKITNAEKETNKPDLRNGATVEQDGEGTAETIGREPDEEEGIVSEDKTVPIEVHEDYLERQHEVANDTLSEYEGALDKPGYRQQWSVVPAGRLTKIWNDYAKTGFVRDESGINKIAETVLDNIHKLSVNNILAGHSEYSPEAYAEDITGEKVPEGHFEKNENFFDDGEGHWRITDYGMNKLEHGAADLMMAKTPEDKLQAIDYILNVTHQRSDLSAWFVEGGQKTLNRLAGKTEDLVSEDKIVPEPAPNKKLQASAQRYAEKQGLDKINHEPVEADPEHAKEIAKIYDEAQHDPTDPRVKAAYDALKSETLAQFKHLRNDLKLKFQPQEEDPYSSAGQMMEDIKKNNALKVYTGGADLPKDHPLAEIAPGTGGETYNTVFRWVHDAMGHAAGGNDFSENGEKSATEAHAQMYSDTARPAMRAETEGQTSWFFHNPEVESGAKQPGEFAQQKATLLPDVSHDWHEAAGKTAAKNEAGGINPRTGRSDTKGVGTEILPEMRQPLDHTPTAQDFQNFYAQHQELFDKYPELRVGWDNKSAVEGGHEINIGAVGPDAARVAKKLDQKSAFNIAKGEVIPTGGTGLRTTFSNYPIEDRIKDLKGEPLSDIKNFEHLSQDVHDNLEPDERDYLKGEKTLQRNVMSQYHRIDPSVAETTNAMQAGAALGGWWKRYIDIFHNLADPEAEEIADTVGPSHAEVLKQWHAAVSGNKSVQDANNLAWHSYADWLDAGKPTDRISIDNIVRQNAAQPLDSSKKGNAAISDTRDKQGKLITPGIDTNKLFNLVNSPEMKGERPFSGDVFRDDAKNPLMGSTEGARKIPSMGATVAGKGNLQRLVIDAHIRDFYGHTNSGGPAAQYIADSVHLRQAAKNLGLKGGEGQEQLWGTVLGLKTLLKEGLTPEAAGSKLDANLINSIGKDYAEVIINDPEITGPGGVLDELEQKYGIGRGSAGASEAYRKTQGTSTSEGQPAGSEKAVDTTLLTETARRIRKAISESKIKKPAETAPETEEDTSFNFGANVKPIQARSRISKASPAEQAENARKVALLVKAIGSKPSKK